LVEHYVYLAERFLAQVEQTFIDLTEHKEMGAALTLRDARLAGLRKWRVKDFEKFLVFYLPRSNGVSIVRVLHAAQNWWAKLGVI